MLRFCAAVAKNHNAVNTLVRAGLKTTVATTRLGWVWWIVDPLVMMMIYYFMVKIIFNRGGDNYHLFALCGIVPWQFFTRNLVLTSQAIRSNSSLIKQVGMHTELHLLIPTCMQTFFALIGVAIIAIWNWPVQGLHTLAAIPLLVITGIFSFSFGIFFAVSDAYFPDSSKFLQYGIRAGFFLTPVLYPLSRVLETPNFPGWAKTLYLANPMAWLIPDLRAVLLDGTLPSVWALLGPAAASLACMQIALWLIRIKANRIMKLL